MGKYFSRTFLAKTIAIVHSTHERLFGGPRDGNIEISVVRLSLLRAWGARQFQFIRGPQSECASSFVSVPWNECLQELASRLVRYSTHVDRILIIEVHKSIYTHCREPLCFRYDWRDFVPAGACRLVGTQCAVDLFRNVCSNCLWIQVRCVVIIKDQVLIKCTDQCKWRKSSRVHEVKI